MKFFIDTADLKEIREAEKLGILDGVTTNPTLVAKTGCKFEDIIRDICSIVDGPISAEVLSLDVDGMVAEARKLSRIHKNIIVKIPITEDGLRTVKILAADGIKTNITLIFSPSQALLAAKVGAAYVSPFVGRLDDASHDGMDIVRDVKKIYANYGFKTQIIVASIRHPRHVVEAALAGADIATIPFSVIKSLVKHPLTDVGIKRFLQDWEKVPR
ncbi:MAG: fructose-6-phosphate aldolase [Acidobacteriota bacterium]